MCTECKCGLPGEEPARILNSLLHHDREHEHEHGHDHADHHHSHDHHHHHDGHSHSHGDSHAGSEGERRDGLGAFNHRRTIEVQQAILGRNIRQAERNRGFFRARGVLALNLLSSPGSGKTTLVRETIRLIAGRLKTAVIVGDLATDNDARRLRETGAAVVQITTGTVCHLDAEMVVRAFEQLNVDGLELLIIENVGNLVCPAAFDLGEEFRVVLLSVTEGEDKPLKYPPIFQSAGALIVSKMDLAVPCEFDREAALANLHRLAPDAPVFELSARTTQGMEEWCRFLVEKQRQTRTCGLIA